MFHFIFDYNYGNLWQILIIFLPQETGMYTLPNVYKLFYVPTLRCRTKNDTKTADRLCSAFCWTIVPDFWRKSSNVRFFPYLLEHFFSRLPTKNLLHSRWFWQKTIFKLNMVNFNM